MLGCVVLLIIGKGRTDLYHVACQTETLFDNMLT